MKKFYIHAHMWFIYILEIANGKLIVKKNWIKFSRITPVFQSSLWGSDAASTALSNQSGIKRKDNNQVLNIKNRFCTSYYTRKFTNYSLIPFTRNRKRECGDYQWKSIRLRETY